MNPFDALIAIIVCFCLIRGIFRGLIKELSSIIGVLAGYYAAYTYYLYLSKFLVRWLSLGAYSNLVSFLILFCGIFIIISILGVVLKYLLRISFLGWVDRICGAGFGLIKGLLIVSILFLALTAFLPRNASLIKESLLAPHMASVSGSLAKIVNKDMKRQFSIKIENLKKDWKKR